MRYVRFFLLVAGCLLPKHQEKAWAERFPAAVQFLFPAETGH